MKVRGGRRLISLAIVAQASLWLAPGMSSAGVINGDFESGTLGGWSVHRTQEVGNWFAYTGTEEPIARQRGRALPQAPPQGTYAAIADQVGAETLILSQDIGLQPGLSQRLNLLAFYDSDAPIAVPAPDTLSVDSEALAGATNQQFRIDVMRPDSPLESLEPADILRTVFRTQASPRPKDSQSLSPTWFSADLSPFAGQTVRLRVAVVASQDLLTAGIDAVSIDHSRPGQPPLGSNRFSFGKVKTNSRKGTATLPVEVPGPGLLTAKDSAPAKASASKAKRRPKLIKPAVAKALRAGTVKLQLKPTTAALAILRSKHQLRVRVAVTFAPTGGQPRTATLPVTLKLETRPRHRRRLLRMRLKGVEPSRALAHTDLNRARLPVPPQPRGESQFTD